MGRTPFHIGNVFHWHAERARQTVVHLDRPLDVAPESGTVYDGASLARIVEQLSDCLYAAGLRAGDRVVIAKDNHYDMPLLAAGAARIGALPVMIAPIASVETVRALIKRAQPAMLIAGARLLANGRLADSSVRTIVVGEPVDEPPSDALTLDDLRDGPRAPVRIGDADEPMVSTHTSGTTGVPKLVLHTANTAIGRFPSRMERCPIPFLTTRHSDVTAAAVSFAHIRVMAWTASQLKMAPHKVVAISDPGLENIERVIDQHRPTILEAMPNMFQRWEELVERRPELFTQARLYVTTFDAVHARTVRTFLAASRRRFPVWGWGLGQSEVTGIIVNLFTRRTVRSGDSRGDRTNIGWPAAGVRVRVVDPESGRRQPRGKPGLLMVKTRARCLTYLGEDERYRAKTEGSWWNSGDLGERIAFGRIRLLDREVDMMPGSSCIEIENVLLDRLPTAVDVTLLAQPDQPPVPVLCMRDDTLDPEDWARALAGLPELAAPRLIPWADVPRTATWKVRRLALRQQVLGSVEASGTGRWT
ncbi:acyl-CoA synthetase (AMP-forming)/AMP-acid ligase II [Asanoa ferruginea]|uniref:Acyl-CoA synthetase (AMP-forming)/AMP-acid ligase II n=1 Tax=Asanoa ferruginea TaxID=53367 RepID=A0A3E0A3T4_9ACTN|nr:class I adenylate-forming enzyme family protein [Asanoa ferruginea]REG00971.1 acyl-CoA synthetase (AMP-forming)/AMP-acid ligase II [Asanoa ferruginea]GIF47570.1 putative fatty-acid-CoA ligase FadD [Asanoa ferruginea]